MTLEIPMRSCGVLSLQTASHRGREVSWPKFRPERSARQREIRMERLAGECPGVKSIFAHIGQAIPNALVIRPEDLQIVSRSTKANVGPTKVEQVVFLGAIYDCRLALGEMTLRAQFPRSALVEVGQ